MSPSTGSIEGGTVVTITGTNFDNTRKQPVVTIGGKINMFLALDFLIKSY